MTQPLLEVHDLSVRFETDDGTTHAVDRISFTLAPGQVLFREGEPGSAIRSVLKPSASTAA